MCSNWIFLKTSIKPHLYGSECAGQTILKNLFTFIQESALTVVKHELSVLLHRRYVLLIGHSDGAKKTIGVSSNNGKVAINSVLHQQIVAFSWECQVLSVEREDVLSLSNHSLNCSKTLVTNILQRF